MHFRHIIIVWVVLLCAGLRAGAQNDTIPRTPADSIPAKPKDSIRVITQTEVKKVATQLYIINGNKYKTPNNYVTVGAGLGYKLSTPTRVTAPIHFGFNFHVKQNNFLIGFLRSDMSGIFSDASNRYLNDFHIATGKRWEGIKTNTAVYGGISRAAGQVTDTVSYAHIGLYAEVQYTRKIFYDVGIGGAFFAAYNPSFPLVGIRLDLYFSNAYRGPEHPHLR